MLKEVVDHAVQRSQPAVSTVAPGGGRGEGSAAAGTDHVVRDGGAMGGLDDDVDGEPAWPGRRPPSARRFDERSMTPKWPSQSVTTLSFPVDELLVNVSRLEHSADGDERRSDGPRVDDDDASDRGSPTIPRALPWPAVDWKVTATAVVEAGGLSVLSSDHAESPPNDELVGSTKDEGGDPSLHMFAIRSFGARSSRRRRSTRKVERRHELQTASAVLHVARVAHQATSHALIKRLSKGPPVRFADRRVVMWLQRHAKGVQYLQLIGAAARGLWDDRTLPSLRLYLVPVPPPSVGQRTATTTARTTCSAWCSSIHLTCRNDTLLFAVANECVMDSLLHAAVGDRPLTCRSCGWNAASSVAPSSPTVTWRRPASAANKKAPSEEPCELVTEASLMRRAQPPLVGFQPWAPSGTAGATDAPISMLPAAGDHEVQLCGQDTLTSATCVTFYARDRRGIPSCDAAFEGGGAPAAAKVCPCVDARDATTLPTLRWLSTD